MIPEALQLAAFAAVLVVAAAVDLRTWRIPNTCVLAALGVRAAYIVWVAVTDAGDALQLAADSLIAGVVVLAALVVLAFVFNKATGSAGLGGGDIKLLSVCAVYFGLPNVFVLMVLACVLGLAFALVRTVAMRVRGAAGGGTAAAGSGSGSGLGGHASDSGLPPDVATEMGVEESSAVAFPFGPAIAAAAIIVMLVYL